MIFSGCYDDGIIERKCKEIQENLKLRSVALCDKLSLQVYWISVFSQFIMSKNTVLCHVTTSRVIILLDYRFKLLYHDTLYVLKYIL